MRDAFTNIPFPDFTLIPKLFHIQYIHTLSLNYNYYAGTGPLLHLVFTKRMLSTVTQISIAYQIVGTESVLVLNLQIELGRAPISSIIPNSK